MNVYKLGGVEVFNPLKIRKHDSHPGIFLWLFRIFLPHKDPINSTTVTQQGKADT